MTFVLLAAIALWAAAERPGVSAQTAKSAPPVPVVVELFTSEGCSSCPPADRLLTELLDQQPVKNALIIGLSEHVDYWDHLGWKDPFSNHQFTERQSAYAAAGGTTDVYTPQMVVDGRESFVGSDRATALVAIARSAASPKAPVSVTWTSTSPHVLKVGVTGATPGMGAVLLAVVEDELRTSVRAGENAGGLLRHSAVARRLTEIGRTDRNGAFTHEGVRVDLAGSWRKPALHVVVLVQAGGSRRIVAAVSIQP